MPDLPPFWEATTVGPMVPPEIVLLMSLQARDAAGHQPLKPMPREAAVAIAQQCGDDTECAAFYVQQSFKESGYRLFIPGDCLDHTWDSASDEYKRTHPRYYQPDAAGKCRPGDGEPLSFGPFQERTQPKTWAEAVKSFGRTLERAKAACQRSNDETCTPLEVVATGKTGTKVGKDIARVRYAEAARIEAAVLFADDPRQVIPGSTSSFTMTISLSFHDAPHAVHHRIVPVISMSVSPDMSM